ncbi:MAG: tRNA (N6-threonylcarbamoyladenosine(37)-N6)-methyltransferase TrmO [Oligoflexus sp.]|nr:tRNA (N6-threonylcarbamoyladenosine(37)-N6)-methyltransferase TrmO [Oligoflexus sp.]
MNFQYQAIGTLQTPFREKFGVPRQSLMMGESRAILKLKPDPQYPLALSHLEQFSHVWIVFVFHKNGNGRWHPLIDTPRVEAGQRMGVFATRSPHRPNPIGISAVKLERIDFDAPSGIEIHLNGIDLLDGTPVLDIKPYVPYADCIPEANSGWIKTDIERYPVSFSESSLAVILEQADKKHPRLKTLIEQMLELDPRPTSQRRASPIAYQESEGMRFAFRVQGLDVHWEVRNAGIFVLQILKLPGE